MATASTAVISASSNGNLARLHILKSLYDSYESSCLEMSPGLLLAFKALAKVTTPSTEVSFVQGSRFARLDAKTQSKYSRFFILQESRSFSPATLPAESKKTKASRSVSPFKRELHVVEKRDYQKEALLVLEQLVSKQIALKDAYRTEMVVLELIKLIQPKTPYSNGVNEQGWSFLARLAKQNFSCSEQNSGFERSTLEKIWHLWIHIERTPRGLPEDFEVKDRHYTCPLDKISKRFVAEEVSLPQDAHVSAGEFLKLQEVGAYIRKVLSKDKSQITFLNAKAELLSLELQAVEVKFTKDKDGKRVTGYRSELEYIFNGRKQLGKTIPRIIAEIWFKSL